MGLDLFRKGVPSMAETFPRRWNPNRGSGGLGAGVYAFRTKEAAERNRDRRGDDDPILVLIDALENPIEPQTENATRLLSRISRKVHVMAMVHRGGHATVGELEALPDVFLSRGRGLEDRLQQRGSIRGELGEIYRNTTGLDQRFNSPDEFGRAMIRGALTAYEQADGDSGPHPQGINHALYPHYDGVAPASDAGGDTGQYGCVIFKEKIDECAGEGANLGYGDTISADALNDCFLRG